MNTKLQQQADQTQRLEYPGHTLDSARLEAGDRAYQASLLIHELKQQLFHIQYCLDQATDNFHSATRAENLFLNALDDLEGKGSGTEMVGYESVAAPAKPRT